MQLHADGGEQSTGAARRRPSHAKLPLAAVLCAVGGVFMLTETMGTTHVGYDASLASPKSTRGGCAAEPRRARASSGGGEVAEQLPRGSIRGPAAIVQRV